MVSRGPLPSIQHLEFYGWNPFASPDVVVMSHIKYVQVFRWNMFAICS